MPHTERASMNALTRRSFLAGTAAVALGGAVAGRASASVPASTLSTPATVERLTGTDPFYVAHRGGGRNWPAMTAYAYSQAVKVPGLRALEISVCLTADDVLVCSHNKTTLDMTGVDYTIRNETWETLSSLMVSPKYTLDTSQPARPFTRFDDVVERYLDDYVLFVEPKINVAGGPLMARMAQLGQPERVVWKQPVNSTRFAVAKDHGFTTWGYVLDEPAHTGDNLPRYAASDDIDLLGVYNAEDDDFMSSVIGAAQDNGKQSIVWELKTLTQRARALGLGADGLMTSNVLGLVNAPL